MPLLFSFHSISYIIILTECFHLLNHNGSHFTLNYFRNPWQIFSFMYLIPVAFLSFLFCFNWVCVLVLHLSTHMWMVGYLHKSFSIFYKSIVIHTIHAWMFSSFFLWISIYLSEAHMSFFIYSFSFICRQAWWIGISGEWELREVLIFWLNDTNLKTTFVSCFIDVRNGEIEVQNGKYPQETPHKSFSNAEGMGPTKVRASKIFIVSENEE